MALLDWKIAQIALTAVGLVVGGAATAYAWFAERTRRRQLSVDEQIKHVEARTNQFESRVSAVEQAQRSAPKHEDLERLYDKFNDLSQSIAHLDGQLGRINESLSRVEHHLLNRSQKANRDDG